MTPGREARENAAWKAALAPGADCIPIEKLGEALSDGEARHLAGCARCQTELSLFTEFQESAPRTEDGAAVAWIAQELRRRSASQTAPKPGWWQRWLPVPAYRLSGALAAMLLLAGGISLYVTRTRPGFTPEVTDEGAYRSQSVAVSAPVGDVDAPPAEFRWQPVPGATVYAVEVLEVDHHSLWKSETAEARLPIPATVRAVISPGKTLLWEVTARNAARATLATSGIQKFRVKAKKDVGGEL